MIDKHLLTILEFEIISKCSSVLQITFYYPYECDHIFDYGYDTRENKEIIVHVCATFQASSKFLNVTFWY